MAEAREHHIRPHCPALRLHRQLLLPSRDAHGPTLTGVKADAPPPRATLDGHRAGQDMDSGMDTFQFIEHLAVALAIGLMIGIERGWKQREKAEGERAAGLRTLALSRTARRVWGALARSFGAWGVLALGLAFAVFTAAIVLFRWREIEHAKSYGATTAVAAMLAFSLGAFAMVDMVAAAAGVATAMLLALKTALHGWLKRLPGEHRDGAAGAGDRERFQCDARTLAAPDPWPCRPRSGPLRRYAAALDAERERDNGRALELKNPFDLTVVLGFGAILAAIMVLAKALTVWTGTTALMALAAVSGLADVDAITLSMARLGRTDLSAQTAALAILLALGVNSASKAVLATMAGGRAIGALVTTGTALAIAAGLAGLWLAAGWDFGAAGQ